MEMKEWLTVGSVCVGVAGIAIKILYDEMRRSEEAEKEKLKREKLVAWEIADTSMQEKAKELPVLETIMYQCRKLFDLIEIYWSITSGNTEPVAKNMAQCAEIIRAEIGRLADSQSNPLWPLINKFRPMEMDTIEPLLEATKLRHKSISDELEKHRILQHK